MEKKNFKFVAYDSKNNQIELPQSLMTFYGTTQEEAVGIKLGLQVGLLAKYKNVRVSFREI